NAALISFCVLGHVCTVGAQSWKSMMYMEGSSSNGLSARVGEHFESRIVYTIGWCVSDNNCDGKIGQVRIRTAIPDPEYIIFPTTTLPPGLQFDGTSGTLFGVPTQAGTWRIVPGVRDKSGNEYNGRGFWFTGWTTDTNSGKRYYSDKEQYVIRVDR
ncbi:MAG TPA: Ig domain-containing protein, partial [Bryobacteraceae bacterium]|nr:Ig domain-containing protein [Bryobacteraceae bacterium]